MPDFKSMTNAELVEAYRYMGGTCSKKFRTKATGIAKCEELFKERAVVAADLKDYNRRMMIRPRGVVRPMPEGLNKLARRKFRRNARKRVIRLAKRAAAA